MIVLFLQACKKCLQGMVLYWTVFLFVCFKENIFKIYFLNCGEIALQCRVGLQAGIKVQWLS